LLMAVASQCKQGNVFDDFVAATYAHVFSSCFTENLDGLCTAANILSSTSM
jgi:hypothetical protein